jgi:hypothetical protein
MMVDCKDNCESCKGCLQISTVIPMMLLCRKAMRGESVHEISGKLGIVVINEPSQKIDRRDHLAYLKYVIN